VGNTPLDLLLVNLKLLGAWDTDLHTLGTLVQTVADATDWDIPVSWPVFGRDAFRTGTGVHAAAVVKALRTGDPLLADQIYSGVPAGLFGRRQEIEVGPMAGKWNIIHWLEQHNMEPTEANIATLLTMAKKANKVLSEEALLGAFQK